MKRNICTGLFFIGFALLLYYLIELPYSDKHIVVIKGASLDVEVMANAHGRKKGLSGRQFLEKNNGMLFLFPKDGYLTFWMKETVIPLSIAYISKQKKIVQIVEMSPDLWKGKIPEYTSKKKVRYALEVNQDWFKQNQVKVGDKVSFSRSIKRMKVE